MHIGPDAENPCCWECHRCSGHPSSCCNHDRLSQLPLRLWIPSKRSTSLPGYTHRSQQCGRSRGRRRRLFVWGGRVIRRRRSSYECCTESRFVHGHCLSSSESGSRVSELAPEPAQPTQAWGQVQSWWRHISGKRIYQPLWAGKKQATSWRAWVQ